MLMLRAPLLTVAALLVGIAYGITFPLISTRLEATGVSGEWIGLNAAMPAAGWIAGSVLVPFLQIRLGLPLKRVLQLFLVTAIIALAALRFAETYAAMTALRLLFGGAMGVFLRCMEYWIDSVSDVGNRGRNVGAYNVMFMTAIIIGSLVQPELGHQGWPAFLPPVLLACCGLALLQLWNGSPNAVVEIAPPPAMTTIARAMPIALLAVIVYGIYESLPTTILQIYALKNGIDAVSAASVLAAAALGNLILQMPVALLSDKVGRQPALLLCALLAAAAAAAIPYTMADPSHFLTACMVFGGAAGSAYSVALTTLGDRFRGGELVVANAAFGVVYSVASIFGPLLNGLALERVQPHGLMAVQTIMFGVLAVAVGMALLRRVARPKVT